MLVNNFCAPTQSRQRSIVIASFCSSPVSSLDSNFGEAAQPSGDIACGFQNHNDEGEP